jgi:hypothetical protein
MKEIKEYGLFRSGTNFLRVILQENYEVSLLTNVGGWKHGLYDLPQQLGREVDCAVCVKNPYAWVLSFYNHRHPQKDVAFDEFARKPLTLKREGPDRPVSAENPLRLWVSMYEHWLGVQLQNHQKFLFRYETVLADPIGSIQELVQKLGLTRRKPWHYRFRRALGVAAQEPKFFLPSIRLGAVPQNYKDKHIKRGESFNASHYTKHEYLKSFSPDLLKFANEQLDSGLLDRLGYQKPGVDALIAA